MHAGNRVGFLPLAPFGVLIAFDIGAKAEIYRTMRELAAQGIAILFVTSDLEEVLALSDRILVMADGRVTGEFNTGTAAAEVIAAATPSKIKEHSA